MSSASFSPTVLARSHVARESLLALAVLVLLLVAFFWQPITSIATHTYCAADLLQDYSLTRIEDGHAPANALLSDSVVQMHPWLRFDRGELARGRLPLWNPWNGGGQPQLANYQSAVFSPFSLPFYVMSFKAALLVSSLAKLFVAALFTFLFLRELELCAGAALVGAIVFAFSGHNVLLLSLPHSSVAAALPACLFFLERALRAHAELEASATALSSAARTRVVALCGFAVSVAVLFLAGQPEPAYFALLLIAAYTLFRVLGLSRDARRANQSRTPAFRLAALLGLAAVLGAGFSAIQLLPFFEYLGESRALVARTGVQTPLSPGLFALHAFPDITGNPAGPVTLSYGMPPPNYETTNAVYVGCLALLLAAVSFAFVRRSRVHAFFALATLVWLVYAYDLFGAWRWFSRIPGLSIAPINRSQAAWHVCVAACAAFAVDRFATREGPRTRLAPALVVLAAGAFAVWGRGYAESFAERTLRYLAFLHPPREPFFSFALHHARFVLTTFGIGALAIALLWLTRSRTSRAALELAIALSVFAQTGWLMHGYNPVCEDRFARPDTRALRTLAEHAGRDAFAVLGEDVLPPALNLDYGLRSIASYDALGIRRYDELYEAAFGAGGNWRYVLRPSAAALQLFGVGWVIGPGEWQPIDAAIATLPAHPKLMFEVTAVARAAEIAQTFQALRPGLSSIAVYVRASSAREGARLDAALDDVASGITVARATLDASRLVEERFDIAPLAFRFEPISDSRGRVYRLRLTSQEGPEGRAPILWGTTSFEVRETKALEAEELLARSLGVAPLDSAGAAPFRGALEVGGERRADGLLFDHAYGAPALEPVARVGERTLFRFRPALGRAWTVDAARGVDASISLASAADPLFEPARVALLSRADAKQLALPADAPPCSRQEVVELADDGVRLAWNVRRERLGLLFVAQPFYPGWVAHVDGVERELLRANHAFQAVALAPGEHVVELSYEPASLRIGGLISLASLVLGSTAALLSWRTCGQRVAVAADPT